MRVADNASELFCMAHLENIEQFLTIEQLIKQF